MTHRRILTPLCLALIAGMPLAAQSGGSIYSFYNLGTLEAGGVGEASGRAGIEAPIRSDEGLNFGNPAGWTGLQYVAIQAGLTFEQYVVSEGDEEVMAVRTGLDHVAAGFPLSDSLPLVVGVGLRPFTSVSYVTGGELTIPSGDSSVSGQAVYSGSGGISQAFAGIGLEPIDRLHLGLQGEFYFGTIERVSRLDFSTGGFINAGYVTSTSYAGIGATAGIQWDPIDELTVGATFSVPVGIEAEEAMIGLYRTSFGDDTASSRYDTASFDIPATVRGGIAWRSGRTRLSGEVLMQDWTTVEEFATTTQSRMRGALGVDYLPDTGPGADGIDRWGIRAGLYYDQTYVASGGDGATGIGGALGVSIPFARTGILGSGAGLDLGLEVGTLGTSSDAMPSELHAKVTAGVRINEFWFR